MRLYRNIGIYVSDSNVHGYGVFTDVFIKKGEIIEECSCIDLMSDIETFSTTRIYNYLFPYEGVLYLPIGLCLSLNSSTDINVEFEFDLTRKVIIFKALKDINPGEELFIHYYF